jgi:hypothetical protein
MAFNLNDTILFQITPEGEARWRAYERQECDEHDAYMRKRGIDTYDPREPQPVPYLAPLTHWRADKWVSMQMWVFARVFGPAMMNGGPQLVKDNRFVIRESDTPGGG